MLNRTVTIPAVKQSEISATIRTKAGWPRWLAIILVIPLMMVGIGTVRAAPQPSSGYSGLVDWIAAEPSENPLRALGDLETAFSNQAHQSNLDYIQQNPDLIATIKSELKSTELSWELVESKRRMLAVPERRSAYAELFETYCREIIDYLMVATGLQNPFEAIFTLDPNTVPDMTAESGVSALLVHNLAEEFVYTYAFHGSDQGSIAVELNQTLFVGELGSYTSTLITREDGSIAFEPQRMTVWQNSAANPYSVLMVPAEETFHILLRAATEQAIQSDFGNRQNHRDITQIVEEWVAVEEAIAGGLVYQLLPAFLEQHVVGFQTVWIETDLVEKDRMTRYRYLKRGIQVVKQLGVAGAMTLYQGNPNQFRALLK